MGSRTPLPEYRQVRLALKRNANVEAVRRARLSLCEANSAKPCLKCAVAASRHESPQSAAKFAIVGTGQPWGSGKRIEVP